METESKNEFLLRQFMIWGSALAGGFGAASMEALGPNISFTLSWTTGVAFLAGMALVASFWFSLFVEGRTRAHRIWRISSSVLLVLGGLSGVLYPLRYVAPNQFPALVTGLAVAACALSGVAAMLYFCRLLFERDDQ